MHSCTIDKGGYYLGRTRFRCYRTNRGVGRGVSTDLRMIRENGGSHMPVALPEPDGEREGIPLWLCPNCDQFKPLQDYGWNMREDICPGQKVWFKQGWCNSCLDAKIKSAEF
jgi:hypothetical protein